MTTYLGGGWLLAGLGYVILALVGAATCYLARRATAEGEYEMAYWKAIVLAILGGWFGGMAGGPLIRAALRTATTEVVRDQPELFGVIGTAVGVVLASVLHLLLYGPGRRRRRADAVKVVFFFSAVASLLVSALILVSLFTNGWGFLSEVVWAQVLNVSPWQPSGGAFSIGALLLASLLAVAIALAVAFPLGFGAAGFVAGSRPSFYALATGVIALLASTPALLLAFLGLQWGVPKVMGDTAGRGLLVLAAGIGTGLVLIPRLAKLSEQARRDTAEVSQRLGGEEPGGSPAFVATARAVMRPAMTPALGMIGGMVVVALLTDSWFFETEWSQIFSGAWNPRQGSYGITTLLMGSLIVTGVAMVVAAPLGLGAAVYLSEYARPRVRKLVKPILEILAAVPSVVVGFFALQWIAPEVVGRLFGEEAGRGGSMMAAGIGVGVLAVPLVASVSEDAMAAVPDSLRDASAGLGSRRITTTIRVVLPAAVSGIVAALILAASRAIGETMVVYMAGGSADTAPYTADPLDGSLTMTAAMASLAVGTDNLRVGAEGELAVASLYFVGIALFIFTLGLNLIGNRFVRRIREVY